MFLIKFYFFSDYSAVNNNLLKVLMIVKVLDVQISALFLVTVGGVSLKS
jgi:hypothetical protein